MPILPLVASLCLLSFPQQPAPAAQGTPGKANALATQMTAAETALEEGNFALALKQLRELAQEQPKNPQVLYDLGFAADQTGDLPQATESYTAAIALNPAFAEAQAALGLLLARQNQPLAAAPHLRAAANIATDPPELRARALRALAAMEEPSDAAAAREDLLAAIKLTGEQPSDGLLTAHLAEQANDNTTAEAAYRRTLAVTPGDPDAVSGLAHALSRRGDTVEAVAMLEDARRTHPDDPRLAAQLAALYAAQGSEGAVKAVALLNDLRGKNPSLASDPALTRQLARLQLVAGNTTEAERLYKSLAEKTPDDGPLLDDLGSVYVQQARFAEAQATLNRAVHLRSSFASNADWAEAAGHLAFAASRNHDPAGALQALAARATVLPNSAASLFLEAISRDALHQNIDAVRVYKAFLTMAAGKLPDEEFQARHRIVALEHMK